MMSILMEQLINITDAVFLGHVGEVELGASAIAGIYYLAVYMLGFGFSIGLQVMIARRNGELNYKATGKTFFQGLFFLSGLAVLLCLLIHAVSPYLLKRLISSPEIYQAVVRYLDWRSFGLLFSFPFLAIRSFFVGITHTKALSWSAVTAVAINIPLNYFLIFTLELGISGAAIASSLAEMGSLIMLCLYTKAKIDKEKYGLKPVYSFPYEFEMRIPPCAPRGSLIVSVGYIHASHKPDFTVYHDNLAVVPVIHLTGENGERYPQERIYLDTRFLHFLKEAVFYIPATHIIIKYTYLHAFFYFLDKELLHLFSYLVITEYIILYMDMVSRFLDLFQQVFELIGTIRINRDLCSV